MNYDDAFMSVCACYTCVDSEQILPGVQSILVQVRSEILSDPNASLDSRQADQAYTEAEARDAFRRMVQRYGWNK